MLCGLLDADVAARPPSAASTSRRDPEGVKRRIGYMSQRFSLYELLTVDQNIRFFGGLYGLDARAAGRAAALRARDGRPRGPRERRSRAISPAAGGSGSRSAARSCTSRRSSFSTSRPAASIRCRAAQFWRLIDTLSQSGVTVLVTTHYLDEAERCHRVAIIHAGRLAALGTTDRAEARLRRPADPRGPRRQRRSTRCALLDALPEVEKTSLFGTAVHAVLARRATSRPDADRRRLRPPASQRRRASPPCTPSLEDVFLDVVDRADAEKRGVSKALGGLPQGAAADPARSPDAD